jgi:hypothetical protein
VEKVLGLTILHLSSQKMQKYLGSEVLKKLIIEEPTNQPTNQPTN